MSAEPPFADAVADAFPEPIRGPIPTRRRHRLRWTLTAVLVLFALVSGAGAYVYRQLNGNIKHVALYAGIKGNAGKEKPDPFGRVPINLLVIGSDTRATKDDCRLGGACRGGSDVHADVEMVVHVSADRSNMTVMSVPRDTEAELPGCKDPATGARVGVRVGQINATLTWGPGCTLAAVEQLTGITIDHIVMVDFAGVIAVSDAVGGVQICVTKNVYDPYSHLKLSAGSHVLKGEAALEFVRSRHAFDDGSDLGRTYSQHAFLSAAIRSLKRKGVLLNPRALYSLAQAATKALTVDTGLDSIPKLLGLASDMNKVPSNRITFTTMQTGADPSDVNRVVVAPAARNLFAAIVNDQSLTTDTGGKVTPTTATTTAPSPVTAVDRSSIVITVRNASGHLGRATAISGVLIGKGFSRHTTVLSGPVVATTSLRYGPGQRAKAQAVAAVLKLPDSALKSSTTTRLELVIGADWTAGKVFPSDASSLRSQRKAALKEAHSQTATNSSCVPVSNDRTVTVNGVLMTPTRAFSESPNVGLSAP